MTGVDRIAGPRFLGIVLLTHLLCGAGGPFAGAEECPRPRPARTAELLRARPALPPTSELLVFLQPGTDAERFAREQGLQLKYRLHSDLDACVCAAASPEAARAALARLSPAGRTAAVGGEGQPGAASSVVRQCFLNEAVRQAKNFTPNDTYFHKQTPTADWPGQWYLSNEYTPGLDLHVLPVWAREVTGAGVTIGIVDDCLQTDHPDLAPNYVAADSWNFGSNNANPNPINQDDRHGVGMAGLAAARGGNGLGICGAAPLGGLAGLRIDFHNPTTAQFVDATQYHSSGSNTNIKIKNHSYSDDSYYVAHTAEETALATSAAAGTIHCFSAGAPMVVDSNKLSRQNSPDVICVTSIGSNGQYTDYSNYGANVFVCAPSSSAYEGCLPMITTDRTGANGYNPNFFGIPDTFPDTNYTSVGEGNSGTSLSCALVSGVLALVKQVQPALNNRLAKHLLVRASDVVDASDSTAMSDGGWRTNAAGFKFNQNYGFGLVNADKLTQEATKWSGVTALTTETVSASSLGASIPDYTIYGATRTFTIAGTASLEEVQVTLNITHAKRGQLAAFLTSPSGYKSRLMDADAMDDGANIAWTFTTNAFWGENPHGTWTLMVADWVQSTFGTWNSYSVTVRMGAPLAAPPSVTTVSPGTGPATGNTAVTISGTNFQATPAVLFGSGAGTSVVLVNGTQITCRTPSGAGPVTVTVRNPDNQTGTWGQSYVYTPVVTSVSPGSGPGTGSTAVTIAGSGFLASPGVTFGGVSATGISLVSSSTIACATPAGSGKVDLTVTNAAGGSGTLTQAFTYQPVVSGVSPSHGLATGGTAVTLNGAGFQTGPAVTFGGAGATGVNRVSSSQVTCTTPSGVGVVGVTLTNADQGTHTLSNGFHYEPVAGGVSPSSGPATLNAAVTITGSGFVAGAAATFGGNSATGLTVVSATTLTCTAPTGAPGTANVVVTNPDGVSSTQTLTYTFVAPPSVTGVAPCGGPPGGGTPVTITGNGFVEGASAALGGNSASGVTVASATRITCTAPSGTLGVSVAVTVTNPDGQSGSLPGAFLYADPPSISGVSPTGYSASGGGNATLTGSNFSTSGTPAVTFDGASATVVSVQSGTLVCVIPAHANPFPTLKLTVNVVVTNPDTQSGSRTYQIYADIEGNVYPQTTGGSGARPTIFDVGLSRQFVSAAKVPHRGVEFQKADVYPLGSHGDGKLDIFDVGQERGYVSGATLNAAAGPTWFAPSVIRSTPSSGTTAGGTAVTITGNYFETGGTVTFGGSGAFNVVVVSTTQITCTTPPHAAGAVTVTVTNSDGLAGSKANAFTYQVPGPGGGASAPLRGDAPAPAEVCDLEEPPGAPARGLASGQRAGAVQSPRASRPSPAPTAAGGRG